MGRRAIDGAESDVIVEDVDFWIQNGMPSEKIVLGIPAYGRSFTLVDASQTGLESPASGPGPAAQFTGEEGFVSFYEVCQMLQEGGWSVVKDPTGSMGPYAFKGQTWMAWDEVEMVKEKVRFAMNRNLGGVMVWEISLDDFSGDFCNLGPS